MASNNLEVKLWEVVVVAEAAGLFRSAANLSSLFIMPMVAGLEINLFPMVAYPPNARDAACIQFAGQDYKLPKLRE